MTLFFQFAAPVLAVLACYYFLRIRIDLVRPPATPFGWIIPRVCVVNMEEVREYLKDLQDVIQEGTHLLRQRRWKQLRIVWAFLRQMSWNTRLFQRVVRFEWIKIDPGKSSLDYAPRENLIHDLVPETTKLRLKLYKTQVKFLTRAVFGLKLEEGLLKYLLGDYKTLEQDMIALAGMSDDPTYRQMLIQNLGLTDWRVFDGGGEPETA